MLPEHRDLDPVIADALVTARRMGLRSPRDAALQCFGPLTDEQWAKMRDAWEHHWRLPPETLQALVEHQMK